PKVLAAVWEELASWPHAAIAFESPQRLPLTLQSLAAALPEREIAVCRELTKAFEEVVRGRADEVAARFSERPKGEITLVLGPGEAVSGAQAEKAALVAVAKLVAAGASRREAAAAVARLTGVGRNRLYRGS